MPTIDTPAEGPCVSVPQLLTWTETVIAAAGTPADIAADVAEVLTSEDARAIASHGTARLPDYIAPIEGGVMDPATRPVETAVRGSVGRLDARNGWGHHAARVVIDRAIDLAGTFGIGTVAVGNSNHFGIAGWYALRAARRGMVGVSLTNSSPLVAPTRARTARIGTNPIAIAAPAGRHGQFCLDMATSTVSRGRIEVADRRGEQLPSGWAIGPDGGAATTATQALEGALQPLGGDEDGAGYKGYGHGLAVDLLTGVLAGAAFGPNVVGLFSTAGPSNLGHFLLAIDPAAIDLPGRFERRLEEYLDQLKAAPTISFALGSGPGARRGGGGEPRRREWRPYRSGPRALARGSGPHVVRSLSCRRTGVRRLRANSDTTVDVAIVGGGIVGLASVCQLLERRPGLRLAILEDLRPDDLVFGPSIVREQALRRDGTLVDDFDLQGIWPRPSCPRRAFARCYVRARHRPARRGSRRRTVRTVTEAEAGRPPSGTLWRRWLGVTRGRFQ